MVTKDTTIKSQCQVYYVYSKVCIRKIIREKIFEPPIRAFASYLPKTPPVRLGGSKKPRRI